MGREMNRNQCPPGHFKCSDGTCVRIGQSCSDSGRQVMTDKGVGPSGIPGGGYYPPVPRSGQGGGTNNPITRVGLQATPGRYVYKDNCQPYVGPYHQHRNGELMIGAGQMGVNHPIKPNEIIVLARECNRHNVNEVINPNVLGNDPTNASRRLKGTGQLFAHPTCDGQCSNLETCFCWSGWHYSQNGWSNHQERQCECVEMSFLE